MKNKYLLMAFLLSFVINANAQYQRPQNFASPKKSIAIASGLGGMHAFLSPTLELKFNRLIYRVGYSYYGMGLGLEYQSKKEMQFKLLERTRYQLGLPMVLRTEKHSYFTLSAYYRTRFDMPWLISERLNAAPVLLESFAWSFLMGSRTYYSNNFSLAFKFGGIYLETLKELTKSDGLVSKRFTRLLSPYGEMSLAFHFIKSK